MCIMGKIAMILLFMALSTMAGESASLQQKCLDCHKTQQIPDNLISKRYLMQYSTKVRIEEAVFRYLNNPKKGHSIMPAPFFLKFPMKEKTDLDEVTLKKVIRAYVEKFDMKKRLILEKP